MRAITVSAFGPPSVLTPAEVPTPTPGPGAVLVEVTGAGVGPWDTKQRQGRFGTPTFPYIPGVEVSGLVAGFGDDTGPVPLGAPVYGRTATGGYADYTVVALEALAAAPEGLDLEAAGAVPIGGCTALEGLDEHLHITSGETVLIAGATGGVGLFAVQIAKARGAQVVATASPANHEFLAQYGADRVLDYHGDWLQQAAGVDAAFDCVGGDTWGACLTAVRDGGRAVTIHAADPPGRDGVTASSFHVTVTSERLETVARLIGAGQVRVEIAARFPLDEATRAHELIEDGHTRGKIVLIPG